MKIRKTKSGYNFKAENKGDCEYLRIMLSEMSKSKRDETGNAPTKEQESK
jgi:hypothetical protein